jgi:hypothetical protein
MMTLKSLAKGLVYEIAYTLAGFAEYLIDASASNSKTKHPTCSTCGQTVYSIYH